MDKQIIVPQAQTMATARQLAFASVDQFQRALTGIVALPSALALGISSVALFGVSIAEASVELLRGSVEQVTAHDGARSWDRSDREKSQPSPTA